MPWRKELAADDPSLLEPRVSAVESKNTDLTAQLAENVNKNPIYLTDRGVSHTKTAAQNTPLIQQAIIDAETTGRPIIVPWVPEGSWIDINERLTVSTGGISISGYGVQSRIRQTVFPKSIFDVLGKNVKVENMFLSNTPFNASGFATPFRGSLLQSFNAGVCVHNDDVTVRNIKIDNMITGVIVSAWDVAGNVLRAQLKNVVVESIASTNVDFTLVVQGVKDFTFDKISGSYKLMPGSPTPPHLIYVDGANGENFSVNGGNCTAFDGLNGQAYQFKAIRGGTISKLSARNCFGVLNVMDCYDLNINDVKSIDDTYSDQDYASLYLQTTNTNVKIDGVAIKMTGDGKPIRIDNETSNSSIKNIQVQSNHTLAQPASSYDVDLRGTNNEVDNVEVTNIGATKKEASVGIWTGTGNTISRPKTSGNTKGVVVKNAGNHKVINYDVNNLAESTKLQLFAPTTLQANDKKAIGISQQDRLIAFERANFLSSTGLLDFTTSGHTWVISFGTFNVSNGKIYSSSGVPGLAYVNAGTANLNFSAGVKYADREALAIRAVDKNNLIGVRIGNTNLAEIFKYDVGVYTLLASSPLTPQVGRRYHFKVLVFGDKVDYFVDDKLMASYTLTADEMTKFGSITNFGLYTRANVNGLFDNIEWRNIE